MKPNKKCVMCGTAYNYCSGCPGKNPAWKVSFCCEDCKKIYETVASYNMKDITKEQAAKALKDIKPEKIEQLNKTNKLIVKEILGQPLTDKLAPKVEENVPAQKGNPNYKK